ncbi:DNA-processing protein DprA [Bacillaceae bacterium]
MEERKERLEERDWLVHLLQIDGVGAKTAERIAKRLGAFAALETVSADFLREQLGLGVDLARTLQREMKGENVLRTKEKLRETGVSIWTIYDADYPAALAEVYDRPLVLYYKGKRAAEALARPMLSIVGTRSPTAYGKRVARELAAGVSGRGWTIVSGMARGIDSEAHRGALEAGGLTVAVLGSGVDVVYPWENEKLYERILENGCVISEYPPGTRPRKGFFPRRNRIISGLGKGTVVVEAAQRSGALITADLALEQGKEVFAVPGPIFSPQSAGPHLLIQQGAKLVTSSADILAEFPDGEGKKSDGKRDESFAAQLTVEEALVLEAIGYDATPFEQIAAQSSLPIPRLQAILLSLQLKRCIEQLPGSRYWRIV